MLEVKNLSVGYEVPILQNLCFSCPEGQTVGILGRNGCGKTTLLRGLLGSIRRFSGEVWIGGQNCTAMNPRQQAACLSVLPQHTDIMAGIRVRQMLEMGRYPYSGWLPAPQADTRERMEQAARLLGLGQLLDADCGRLSQGQRMLVLLGRLLVQDTPVMLLDEPNAALDYDNTQILFRLLREQVEGQKKTALLVLHDPELALRWCDRLLLLKEGRICGDVSTKSEEAALTQALKTLYPEIHVRKDPYDGRFRCYI